MKAGTTLKLGIAITLLSALALTSGCSRATKIEDLPMDAAWHKIMERYNKHRYLDASDQLEVFLINHAGTALADSAQLILAECHYKMKEYIISADEYQKLFTQYPQSPLAEQGEYKMGLSYYMLSPKFSLDQQYTQKAIDTFQLFIEDFPSSKLKQDATDMIGKCRDKLAHKEFFNARLYHKMKEYPAARIYYDLVLSNYYDTPYAAKAQYYKALSYQNEKNWTDAINEYSAYLDKFGKDSMAKSALSNLNTCRAKLKESKSKGKGHQFLLPAGQMEENGSKDDSSGS